METIVKKPLEYTKRKLKFNMTFVIVHFNTPELTTCLCSSIYKHHPDAKIILFDNSTTRPFVEHSLFNIDYKDNTKGQLINFDTVLNNYPIDTFIKNLNNLGSAKHALSIDYVIKHLDVDEVCLLDSDILIKKPLDFFDSTYITIGELSNDKQILFNNKRRMQRIFPHCQYINVNQIRGKNISFFDANRITGIDISPLDYDTGASFYEDVKNEKIKFIRLDDYVIHFGAASWENKNYKQWLISNKEYWR